MRLHSEYLLICLCGKELRTETGSVICPNCHRQIRVEWPAPAKQEAPKVTPIDMRRVA